MSEGLEGFSYHVKRWLPVGIWMVIILAASTGWGSTSNSYHLLRPILRWFDPTITEPEVYRLNLLFRKTMHVVEFAILALMVWKVYRPLRHFPRPGDLRVAGCALAVALAFGIGSELVQALFPKDRGASVGDVFLDLGGALLGLLIVLAFRRRRPKAPQE